MDQKFEIYQIAVEMADRVSARRLTSNAFFVTVNTGLAGLLGFAYANVSSDHRFILWIVSVVGLLLSLTWFFAIRSYKRLNRSKFEVIHELEADLDFQYFKREWESLKRLAKEGDEPRPVQKRWLEWKDRYTDLSTIEGVVPIVYGLIYLVFLLLAIIGVGLK